MSDDTARPAGRFALTIWLVVSAAANLFLLGLLIGSWMSAPSRGGPPPRPPLQTMLSETSGKLSPEGFQKLSRLINDIEERFRGNVVGTTAIRESIRAQLLQEQFDVAAFTRALDQLNAAFAQARNADNRRFAEVIATLSPDDRKQLANVRFP